MRDVWTLTLTAIVLVFSGLTGCQTVVTPLNTAKNTPPERVFFLKKPTSNSPGRVVFVRDGGFLGSGVHKRIYIDDELAAILDVGEMVEFRLDPSDYIFSTHAGPASTILANTPVYLDQRIEAGKTYYYRLYSDMNKPGQFGRVPASLFGFETK